MEERTSGELMRACSETELSSLAVAHELEGVARDPFASADVGNL